MTQRWNNTKMVSWIIFAEIAVVSVKLNSLGGKQEHLKQQDFLSIQLWLPRQLEMTTGD